MQRLAGTTIGGDPPGGGQGDVVVHLFTYGTLRCEDIMQDVAGCLPDHLPALIKGYVCQSVRGEDYPALLPTNGGSASGVVYFDVPGSAWPPLDRFEGGMYARRMVEAELEDGRKLQVQTYVVPPEFETEVAPAEWDYVEFLRAGKARFRSRFPQ